jgi:hypothetical protein
MVTAVQKSIDDCINEARLMVNDAALPYRNTDDTLIAYLNSALLAVYQVRPDAYIGDFSSGIVVTTTINMFEDTDLGLDPATLFPLDPRMFFYPVVSYIAGRIELADDEFTETSRSAQLLQAFKQQLQGM